MQARADLLGEQLQAENGLKCVVDIIQEMV
jgi:hypothetical protein